MPAIVPPKLIPGRLNKENKGAADWGRQNLLAYGCHYYVVIADPISLAIIQTLDEHRAFIVCVKWCPESLHNDLDRGFKLRLASGDKTGNIIVWNALDATIVNSLQENIAKQQVLDMKWHTKDPNLLLALYSPSSLILWNITAGSKLDFNDPLSMFEINPFDNSHIALASSTGMIYFVSDFKTDNKPTQVELKYTINSNRGTSKSTPSSSSEFQQMVFSPHTRNIMYYLLAREVIIFDSTIHQPRAWRKVAEQNLIRECLLFCKAVGSIVLDRTRPSFSQLLLLRDEPNLALGIHEDGSMTAWKKRKNEYRYDLECFSDIIRFNKQSRKKGTTILAVVNSPLQERKLATVASDGSILVWDYNSSKTDKPADSKFCITGLVENISSAISSLCVSPFPENDTLLALGTYSGTVQIIDMIKSETKAEFMLWPQAVRGVRWFSPTSVIAFNCEEYEHTGMYADPLTRVTKNEFKNKLAVLDLKTGKQQELRKVNGTEGTFIRAIRISSARQYFILLLKDRPFEIWDMKTLTLLRTMKPFSQITSLEWSPVRTPATEVTTRDNSKVIKEQFVFALPDGTLRFFAVNNGVVTPAEVPADLGMGIISSLAWKDDLLVSGDTAGSIHSWNFNTKKSQAFATNKGLIRRIRFSPAVQAHQIIVLFNEGDFGVWDLDHGIRLSISNYLKGRDLKAIDVDWLSETTPVVATTDGCIRVLDRSLSTSSSSFMYNTLSKPIFTPYVLPPALALHLKAILQHYLGANSLKYITLSEHEKSPELSLLEYVDPRLLQAIQSAEGTAAKCLIVAQFFGNDDEIKFWLMCQWALKHYSEEPKKIHVSRETKEDTTLERKVDSTAGTVTGVQTLSSGTTISTSSKASSLPSYFDLLLENDVVRNTELERASIQESKRSGYDLTKKIAEGYILLGQKEKAIELLLQTTPTPADNQNFYRDALKAAIVAASISQESFKNTMKLIATNLIANSNLDEGVQLLCLIGKSFDACRYLQTYDRWTDAAWLAKVSLTEPECSDILKRWAAFLNLTNEKVKAFLILTSLGEFQQVLQLLHESKQSDVASLFAAACAENGIPLITDSPESTDSTPSILESVRFDYGNLLNRFGNTAAAQFYWKQAGTAGQRMLNPKQLADTSSPV